MNADEAIAALADIRRKWRNNGSTIEFNKAEGAVFQTFRAANADWETTWSAVQQAAHEQVK